MRVKIVFVAQPMGSPLPQDAEMAIQTANDITVPGHEFPFWVIRGTERTAYIPERHVFSVAVIPDAAE